MRPFDCSVAAVVLLRREEHVVVVPYGSSETSMTLPSKSRISK
jgi:hypothetical protein